MVFHNNGIILPILSGIQSEGDCHISGSSRNGSNYSSSYNSNSTSNNYSSNSTSNNYSSNSNSNYSSDVGRAGRGRYRDSSTDYSAKLRQDMLDNYSALCCDL